MLAGFIKTRAYSKRHYVPVMAFAIVLVGGIYFFIPSMKTFLTKDTIQIMDTRGESVRSAPVRLEIPALALDTTFVPPLGLLPDQTVSVPDSYTKVGWYSGGVSPGEVGPSVILGHVDSKEGPAVFYSLGQLKVGDEIKVTREDLKEVIFKITKIARHPQLNFPTLAVYGPTDKATLRLVTCSGKFDKDAQLYSHNLIIFAELAV